MRKFLIFAVLVPCAASPHAGYAQQVTGQDLDKVLERADLLLKEAKSAYEEARSKSSVPAFIDAGFKLEEARIKYLVLQEIGSADKQKIASDRLRAVNQLTKLIHDGKVAITASPEQKPLQPKVPDNPIPQPADPAPPRPLPPAKFAADVTKRVSVPDPSRVRDAEKTIRELFKDQYSKKAAADRQQLARTLLEQADKTADDPVARWVLIREAQDLAAQAGDLRTALQSVESASLVFDVDPLILKSAAIAATGKSAKTPPEFAALTLELLKLTDEFMGADQYDQADKTVQAAAQHARRSTQAPLVARATAKTKEVADAKARFASMKKSLEALAKNPEDGPANLEMGLFLCFVKGSWDLGLRFLAKGSDTALKSVAEKEISCPTESADQAALGDAWWEISEKARIPGAKEKVQARVLHWYEAALPGASGLSRIKIEKRLAEFWKMDEPAPTGLVARWVCNEGSGTTLSDTSGKGNHGTLKGVQWSSGLTGHALDFSGGGHVSCGVAGMPPLNGPLTLAWAAYSPSEPGKSALIVLDDASSHRSLSPGYKDGRLAVWKWGEAMLVSTTPPPPGEWHQFAYTVERGTHKLYVDGALKDSSTAEGPSGTVKRLELGMWVGGGGFNPDNQYRGQLDEIRIYSRALTEAEVRSLVKQRK